MDQGKAKALRLFNKEVYQTPPFIQAAAPLEPGTVELIIQVTATHYPLFRRLKHGLVVGQLSEELPQGYEGPGLEFLYKTLSNKVCFIWLKVGGFSQAELAAFEADHDL
jgi:hypothetical protein